MQVEEEHRKYKTGLEKGAAIAPGSEVDMGMIVRMVHGDEVISDSKVEGSFAAASLMFKKWVRKAFLGEE